MNLAPTTLRHAFAALRRSPGFALGVLLTFALGIGINTAVFSAAWTLLLAPLPIHEPGRVVNIQQTRTGTANHQVAPANFLDWRREAKSFSAMASWFQPSQILEGVDEPMRIEVAQVSANYFDLMGVAALRGRMFNASDSLPLAVVSEELWRDDLGGRDLDGLTIRLDGETFDVVGVAPPEFDLPARSAAWTLAPHDVAPIGLDLGLDPTTLRGARYLGVLGRLAPRASVASARSEMEEIAHRLELAYPEDNHDTGAGVEPLATDLGRTTRGPLLLLAGAAGCVLLVACINVAGLLLARHLSRRRDLAVRKALGAGHGQLLADAVAESALLAGAGGLVGLALAARGAPLLVAALPGATTAGRAAGTSPWVIAFAAALALLATLAAAVTPALFALRTPANSAMAGSRGMLGGGRSRLRSWLVVGQAALAVLLVAGALLMTRTLQRMIAVDPGFDADSAVTMRLWLPADSAMPPAERRSVLERAVAAAADTPGVARAGGILKLPLSGTGISAGLRVEGYDAPAGQEPDTCWRTVSVDYFGTMGIRLLAGRRFDSRDSAGSEPVAVVNQTLARRFWPGGDPIGKRIATGIDSDDGWVRVVGVVADTPQVDVATVTRPEMYRPLAQPSRFGSETLALVARTGPGFALGALRERLRAVSPSLVVDPAQPLADLLRRSTGRERVLGLLLGLFSGLTLVLAGIGLHGVLALLVAAHRREMGLRLAVGATSTQLAVMVVRRGVTQAALGALIGLPAAVLLGHELRSWLWRVEPTDPLSLGGALLALLAVAVLAAWLPARRVARIDPATTLREE